MGRTQIAEVEKHASRLFERVERLQDRLPDFTDACIEYVSAWGRRKRWDFLMQIMRHLVLKLQQVSESMHCTLSDLEGSLGEDELSGGMATVIDPQKRFKQEQMIISLDLMQQESKTDFREATETLRRLIELTEPTEQVAGGVDDVGGGMTAIQEDEAEGIIDMSPPRVVENRNLMKHVYGEMFADTEEGGFCFRGTVEDHIPDGEATRAVELPKEASVARELATTMGERPREDLRRSTEPDL